MIPKRSPRLTVKMYRVLRDETVRYGYDKMRFYHRHKALWHNFYGRMVREPYEDFATVREASCHYWSYRDRRKAEAMEKRNAFYERLWIAGRGGIFGVLSPMGRAHEGIERGPRV